MYVFVSLYACVCVYASSYPSCPYGGVYVCGTSFYLCPFVRAGLMKVMKMMMTCVECCLGMETWSMMMMTMYWVHQLEQVQSVLALVEEAVSPE